MIKICFLAPSGYGKSTAVNILKAKYNVLNIKIAEPLYKMQEDFYKKLQLKMKGEQDGELLQFFGQKIRKESPSFLLNEFQKKLNSIKENDLDIILNDDCRPSDYIHLKKLGFEFIRITGVSHLRKDHSPIDKKIY